MSPVIRHRWQTLVATITQAARRNRFLWMGVAWLIAFFEVSLGGAYLFGGSHLVVSGRAFKVFAHVLPWGLHAHGMILLVTGISLIAGLAVPAFGHPEPSRLIWRSLLMSAAYFLWTCALFACAPLADGTFSYTATVTWLGLSALPILLCLVPLPSRLHRDETGLIRAAVEVGITPAQAARLAGHYFRPDGSDESH